MCLTRRRFLATSALLAGGAVPTFWQRVASAAPAADQPAGAETILVVVELTGGNDGLNTVIPITDPAYAKNRPTLAARRDATLRVTDDLALHPSLRGLATLLERGQLAIVQGVGYPNPNRSHFVSMDFWHTATLVENEPYGWLGLAAGELGEPAGLVGIGSAELPLALTGPAGKAVSLRSIADYQLRTSHSGDSAQRRRLIESFAESRQVLPDSRAAGSLLERVRQTARETYASAERLRKVSQVYGTPVSYPQTGLASRLKLVAQLIAAGVPDRVFYTSLAGFDTHSDQAKTHAGLLEELGDALAAFQNDLVRQGQSRRVMTLTFSEFGRRVKENGSQGTDHGAASQMFLIGDSVRPGPIGAHPSLSDLDDGDLKHHTDFRQVYQTILEDWLKVPAKVALRDVFPPLELFRPRDAG